MARVIPLVASLCLAAAVDATTPGAPAATPSERPTVRSHRASGPVTIDGELAEPL